VLLLILLAGACKAARPFRSEGFSSALSKTSEAPTGGLPRLMPVARHLGSPGTLTPFGRLISESVSGLLLQFLWLRLPSGRLTDSSRPRRIVEGKRHQGSGNGRRRARDRGSGRPIG
jgi:hypothetical protein